MNTVVLHSQTARDIIDAHCRHPDLCAIRQRAVLTLCKRGVAFDRATTVVDGAILSDVLDDAVIIGTLLDCPVFERTLELDLAACEVDAILIGRLLTDDDTTFCEATIAT